MSRLSRRRLTLEPLEDRILLSAIHGSLFDDRTGNGVRDAREAPAVGRTVFLDTDRDGVLDGNERRTTTGEDGSYTFANLPAGRYLVSQLLPAGWRATRPEISPAIDSVPDGGKLIGLDRFRDDPRFAEIDGRGLSVVVIDSGIGTHPAFPAGTVAAQYDFVENDAVANDEEGHGTIVSSIIASRDADHPGIAPGVQIISLKVLDGDGNGDFRDIERALQWVRTHATTYNVVAVNLSLGDSGNYDTFQSLHGIADELQDLAGRGITLLAAAGNDHAPGTEAGLTYPAIDSHVIPIGAVWDKWHGGPWGWASGARDHSTAPDRIASFSQRVPGVGQLFAPGTLLTAANIDGGTSDESGTSVATAVASGVVALAQQLARDRLGRLLGGSELRDLLEQTSVTIRDGDNEDDNVRNTNAAFGRIDVMALAEAILALGSVSPGHSPRSREVGLPGGESIAGVDLGSFREGTLSGVAFTDRDGDGWHEEGEAAISGRLVFADLDNDGRRDHGESFDYTDSRGQYTLTGLGPGVVRVRQELPAGHRQTSSVPAVTITSGFALRDVTLGSRHERVNSAPTLTGDGTSSSLREDATNPAGFTVAAMLGNTFRDGDASSPRGIAVAALTGEEWGRWQYSLAGGSGWIDLSASASRALLLRGQDRLRFLPDANANGTATIDYHAWDQSAGQADGRVDLTRSSATGGTTAFSAARESARVEVRAVNDAPTLNGPGQLTGIESGVSSPPGDRVLDILVGTVGDGDAGARIGMAIVGSSGQGRWQFSRDGATWTDVGSVSASHARLLAPGDRLRFVPWAGITGKATVTCRAWDQTTGTAGGHANLSGSLAVGGKTAFSPQVATATLTIEPAQASASSESTIGQALTAAGHTLGANEYAAIIAAEGEGTWQYSLDGTTWREVGQVSDRRALLLSGRSRVRFVGESGAVPRLKYRIWQGAYSAGAVVDLVARNEGGEVRALEWGR